MKLKIMQQGGGIVYTPFIPQGQATAASSSASSKSSSEDAKLDPLDKELLALMKDQNLLPSDIQVIYDRLINFQQQTQSLSSLSGFGGTDSYRSVMPGMLQIMQMTSTAKYNKDQWKEALTEVQKHDAGSEVAMDSYGRIYVNTEDGINLINPENFDAEKHAPISNSELIRLRETKYGFSDEYLQAMRDVVGKKDVYQAINEIISKFGTKETAQLISKDTAVQNILADANSPDGIYKLERKYTAADLNKAFKVIYDELPRNMQNLLKADAAISGESPLKGAYQFIHNIVLNNTSSLTKLDYDTTASKATGVGGSGDGSGSDAKNLREYNYVERLAANQNAGLPERLSINKSGKNIDLDIFAFNQGPIVKDKDENAIDAGILSEIRKDAYGLSQVATQDSVQFGDQTFSKSAQDTIYYDKGTMYTAKLPWTRNNRGDIVVDYKVIDLLDDLNQRRKNGDLSQMTPDMLNRLLKETDPRLYINEQGQIAWADSKWFIGFEAYTVNNFENDLDTSSDWITKVTGPDEDKIREKFEAANKYGYVNVNKNAKELVGRSKKQGQFIINWRNHDIYKSFVWMPVTRNTAGSSEFYSAGNHMDNYNTAMAAQKQEELRQQMITGVRRTNF